MPLPRPLAALGSNVAGRQVEAGLSSLLFHKLERGAAVSSRGSPILPLVFAPSPYRAGDQLIGLPGRNTRSRLLSISPDSTGPAGRQNLLSTALTHQQQGPWCGNSSCHETQDAAIASYSKLLSCLAQPPKRSTVDHHHGQAIGQKSLPWLGGVLAHAVRYARGLMFDGATLTRPVPLQNHIPCPCFYSTGPSKSDTPTLLDRPSHQPARTAHRV